jgi:hypothetical protein
MVKYEHKAAAAGSVNEVVHSAQATQIADSGNAGFAPTICLHALRNSPAVLLRMETNQFHSRANQGNVSNLGLTILNIRSTINRLTA